MNLMTPNLLVRAHVATARRGKKHLQSDIIEVALPVSGLF